MSTNDLTAVNRALDAIGSEPVVEAFKAALRLADAGYDLRGVVALLEGGRDCGMVPDGRQTAAHHAAAMHRHACPLVDDQRHIDRDSGRPTWEHVVARALLLGRVA